MRRFLAHRGNGAVPGIDYGVGRQSVDALAQGTAQGVRVTAGEVGAPDGTVKQYVARKQRLLPGNMIAQASGRMPRRMDNFALDSSPGIPAGGKNFGLEGGDFRQAEQHAA